MVVLAAEAPAAGTRTPGRVCPYSQLVAYLDELVGGIGVGVAADERRGEVRPAAVVAAAVRVEAFEGEVVLDPGGVLEGVGLEEGDNVVLDGDVLAAAYRQMAERVDSRAQDAADQGDARDGRVAQVEAGQAGAVGGYDLLEQGVERVGLGLAVAVVGRLVARRADGDGGLGQSEGQRAPGEGVVAQKVAQVARGVVELEEGCGGDLGEQRFEDGGIGRDDGFEEAERGGGRAGEAGAGLGGGGHGGEDGAHGRGRVVGDEGWGLGGIAGVAGPDVRSHGATAAVAGWRAGGLAGESESEL